MLLNSLYRPHAGLVSRMCVAFKHTVDYSKVPKINESDLTEQFIRGSGPGGSAVNKNSNCVVLTHVPTDTGTDLERSAVEWGSLCASRRGTGQSLYDNIYSKLPRLISYHQRDPITHFCAGEGTVIKCHTSRCQDENRKKARELLIAKLDQDLNGEDSITAQKKRLDTNKYRKTEYKKKKMAQMKSEWKKREGLA